MSVSVGEQAPDFELISDEKEAFKLSDHSGKNVLLLFFPAAFTGVCTTELNAVSNDIGRYTDLNAAVIGISSDTPFTLAEFKKVNGFQFPLLSDHSLTVSTAYGTNYNPGEFVLGLDRITRRSAVLIDGSGTVQYKEVLESAGDQPNFELIDAKLKEIAG